MRLHGNVTKRLNETREECRRLEENLRTLDEQISYQRSVADDAVTRATVDESGLASQERRAAEEDLRRTEREREETRQRLADLHAEQDRLLERLAEKSRSGEDKRR